MGEFFPYLDAKEVYDLVLYESEEWLILRQSAPPEQLTKLRKRYRHVHTIEDLLGRGNLFLLLSSGISLLKKDDLGKSTGLDAAYIVTYSLHGLSHVEKTRFGYALRGRKQGEGMLPKLGARMLGRNALLIPTKGLGALETFFQTWRVDSSKTQIFVPHGSHNNVDNQQKEDSP